MTEKKNVIMNWIQDNKAFLVCIAVGFLLGRRSISTKTIRLLIESV